MKQTLMQQIKLWVGIVRPHTLFAAVAPVLVGLMVAGLYIKDNTVRQATEEHLREAQLQEAINSKDTNLLQGLDVLITDDTVELLHTEDALPRFSWGLALVTLLCTMALQIFANLVNDYHDYRRGADRKGRTGFYRPLAEGIVTPQAVKKAVYITLACVIVLGFILISHGGWPIMLIGVASIFFAWLYTATRHSLSYLGVADIFVFIFFGVVATAGTTWLQTDCWSWQSFLAGGVNGAISVCVLCINNLRDCADDAAAGKKTLVVRLGARAGMVEMALCVVASCVFAWVAFGFSWPCFIVLPMAGLFLETRRAKGKEYNKCLVHAGLCNMIYVLLLFITMMVRLSA